MELVGGETIADRLQRGSIPVDEAVALGTQIAEALEAAHAQGIIHRDLKPANIKVTPDGQIKVLDFGLAKAMEPATTGPQPSLTASPTLSLMATQAGMILGTAAYMSPEQAKGLATDPRTDVFSFGVVLFEMLSSRQPFSGGTVPDILASVLAREPDFAQLPATVNSACAASCAAASRRTRGVADRRSATCARNSRDNRLVFPRDEGKGGDVHGT